MSQTTRYHHESLPVLIDGMVNLAMVDKKLLNSYVTMARQQDWHANLIYTFFAAFRYWVVGDHDNPRVTLPNMQEVAQSPLFAHVMRHLFDNQQVGKYEIASENWGGDGSNIRPASEDHMFPRLLRPDSALWKLPVNVSHFFKTLDLPSEQFIDRQILFTIIANTDAEQLIKRWRLLGLDNNELLLDMFMHEQMEDGDISDVQYLICLPWLPLLLGVLPDKLFRVVYNKMSKALDEATEIDQEELQIRLEEALSVAALLPSVKACVRNWYNWYDEALYVGYHECSNNAYSQFLKVIAKFPAKVLNQLASVDVPHIITDKINLYELLFYVVYYFAELDDFLLKQANLSLQEVVDFIVQHAGDKDFIAELNDIRYRIDGGVFSCPRLKVLNEKYLAGLISCCVECLNDEEELDEVAEPAEKRPRYEGFFNQAPAPLPMPEALVLPVPGVPADYIPAEDYTQMMLDYFDSWDTTSPSPT